MPGVRISRKVAAAVLASVVMLPGTPTAARAASDPRVVTFAGDPTSFANPERGFYRYSETHLTGDPRSYQRLDPVQLADLRKRDGVTLVFRYFYLDGYAGVDTIAPGDLGLVRADMASARLAGVKLILRFAYSSTSPADAPAARVVGHVQQLAPIINENADVVEAVQAGLIGRWGEWYYTDNFASDPARPWLLTDADWLARGQVLRALLDNLQSSVPVAVRYPAIRQRLASVLPAAQVARIGIHDDCFLAGTDDYGTFTSDFDRTWLAAPGNSAITGGESCVANAPRSDWGNASAELARYRYTYLNADYHQDVLNSWGSGRDEAARRLGYRIQMVRATGPATAKPGETVTVAVDLTNTGYAQPAFGRPVELIVKGAAQQKAVAVTTDVRTWTPGRTVTLSASFAAPTTSGTYQLFLNLPDRAAGLTNRLPLINGDVTNAAYAIRLANQGTWNDAYGWNDLRMPLSVA